MGKEFSDGQMVECIKEIGITESNTEKGYLGMQMALNF